MRPVLASKTASKRGTEREGGREGEREREREGEREIERGRQAGREAGNRQSGRQAGRKAGRQAGRQTDSAARIAASLGAAAACGGAVMRLNLHGGRCRGGRFRRFATRDRGGRGCFTGRRPSTRRLCCALLGFAHGVLAVLLRREATKPQCSLPAFLVGFAMSSSTAMIVPTQDFCFLARCCVERK
jgi:hypothetical protein